MSRASHCRDQAALCRELARQISNHADAKVLREQADRYDAEACALEPRQAGPSDGAS
jgi:hypothetical protein